MPTEGGGEVQRLRLATLAALVVGVTGAVGTALPAGARDPGPAQLPALSVKVQDSCTGAKVNHLVVSAALPGSSALSPSTVKKGSFVFQSLDPGTYLLSVSAPGYELLSDGSDPGVEFTKDPGPIQVPGTTITEGLIGVIQLVPINPPPVCGNPGPVQVNALTGIVDNAVTGAKVKHLSVTITNPANGGETDPGPVQKSGKFIQANLPPGTWDLSVSAPGYSGFSGVAVTRDPGPAQDIGTITFGTELGVLLPAVQ